MTPRLASSVKVSALLRRVAGAGGFGAVLARGDATAGSIAVVLRDGPRETLLVPVLGAMGDYEWQPVAGDPAIPGWIETARRYDPDLWVIELDTPQAAQFVAEMLGSR